MAKYYLNNFLAVLTKLKYCLPSYAHDVFSGKYPVAFLTSRAFFHHVISTFLSIEILVDNACH